MNEKRRLHEYSRRDQIGQCFHPAAFIHDSEEGIAAIERYIDEYKIGGLTFFYSRKVVETNFNREKAFTPDKGSTEKLASLISRYQKQSETPLLVSIDAEWGLGMRISGVAPFPYPMTLANSGDTQDAFNVGRSIAKELKAVGINFNLAPVVDINSNAKNPVIGHRSFGDHPDVVYKSSRAFCKGMRSEGVISCIKHFPGHGDTTIDSHQELPIIDKSKENLYRNELIPFQKLIREHLVDCVMTAHILLPQIDNYPVSLSSNFINEILRGELRYYGAVMTDALNMRSVFGEGQEGKLEYDAFKAGNDILSFSMNLEKGVQLIDDSISDKKINESFLRVMNLKRRSSLAGGLPVYPPAIPDSSLLRLSIARKVVKEIKSENNKPPRHKKVSIISFGKEISLMKFGPVSMPVVYAQFSLCEPDKLAAEKQNDTLILAVYPPSYKPKSLFGFKEATLEGIHRLAGKCYTELYLFGNPLCLELFKKDKFKRIVLAYQDLPEYEQAASEDLSEHLNAGEEMLNSVSR